MPDLPTRAERERELAAGLLILWRRAVESPTPDELMRVRWAEPAEMRLTLGKVYVESAERLAAEKGIKVAPGIIDKAAERWSTVYAERLAGELANTTNRMATDALGGADQGLGTFADLMADGFSAARAEAIAATEVTRAITAGEVGLVGYLVATADIRMASLWHTAEDDRVCELCESLDGVGQEIYGMVSIDGPPAHPNCRCWLDWEEA